MSNADAKNSGHAYGTDAGNGGAAGIGIAFGAAEAWGMEEGKIYVYVTGAVNRPGVYGLEKSSMIVEAVEAAGGLTREADEENINMVYRLEGNAMLNIKRKTNSGSEPGSPEIPEGEEWAEASQYGSGVRLTNDYDGQLIVLEDTNNNGPEANNGVKKISINNASKEVLSTLPGIGTATADKIITYREKNGAFKKIEDIMKVTGIKQAKFDAIKDLIMT